MTVPRQCVAFIALGDSLGLQPGGMLRICRVLILTLGLALVTNDATIAQVRPEVRDRVVPAVVRILVMAEVTEGGVVTPQPVFSGSGTIISATGQILTNWHVIDMAEHQSMLESWEVESAANGRPISVKLISDGMLILTSDGESPPEPRYVATIAAADEALDLAVLQVIGDGNGLIDPELLNLPFVPLGDSDAVGLGDPVDLFGYPGISDGTLTYTAGVVSGFITNTVVGRVWINTDATMSSGSSGGTAINREGELIGVPTQGSLIDCRPADMNQDGRVDSRDVGCLASAGSIGQLRPINLALDLIGRASAREPTLTTTSTPSSPPPVTPTSTPSPALTPAVREPTPNPEPDVSEALLSRLPDILPVAHASCFWVERDDVITLPNVIQRLGDAPNPSGWLQENEWQGGAYRVFACDDPPQGEAGWVEVNAHQFGDADSAQYAVDYFATARSTGTLLIRGTSPPIGDYAVALSGRAVNGKEITIYASQGPLLVRVTGISPTGIPFINVLTVAQSLLSVALPQPEPQSRATAPQGVEVYLPDSLPLSHASCFRVDDIVTLDFPGLIERFPGTADAAEQLKSLGWETGAYRQFSCETPPVGGVNWIDISVHRFGDAASAAAAVPFFADARTVGTRLHRSPAMTIGETTAALRGPSEDGLEYTFYMSDGPLLFRVTGVAPDGDPAPEVERVMLGLLADSISVGQGKAPSVEVLTPLTTLPTAIFIQPANTVQPFLRLRRLRPPSW